MIETTTDIIHSLRMLNDNVLLRRLDPAPGMHEITAGGIVVPEGLSENRRVRMAEVVAVGKGVWRWWRAMGPGVYKLHQTTLKPGDTVLFCDLPTDKHHIRDVETGQVYMVMPESIIEALVEAATEELRLTTTQLTAGHHGSELR